jgi:hypothetical protein
MVSSYDGWQSLGIKASLHDRVRTIAAREQTTMSDVVRRAIDLYAATDAGALVDAADGGNDRERS